MSPAEWTLRREGNVAWLSFEAWDGVHCLHSTRIGGISSAPFAALNLSFSVGDLEENVEENRRRLGAVSGFNLPRMVCNTQVHSDKVNIVDQDGQGGEGDALLTSRRDISLGVSVADCLPVFICDRHHGAIGLVHAGRMGTLKGITRKTVLKMGEVFGTQPHHCAVLFGPAIGPCCYEIGSDIAEQFESLFPGSVGNKNAIQNDSPGDSLQTERPPQLRSFLDLPRANEIQLREIGVEEILNPQLCTSCRGDLFFSHRRDGGQTGRMLGIIQKVS